MIDPEKFQEIMGLAESMPSTIQRAVLLADQVEARNPKCLNCIWAAMWDKPLFSNIKSEIAERNVRDILSERWGVEAVRSPYVAAQEGSFFDVKPSAANGKNWKAAKNFDCQKSRKAKVAKWRLHAIKCCAEWLIERHKEGSSIPLLDGEQVSKALLAKIVKEVGKGWGPISVLHAYTDLGLAVKPDIHLIRTWNYVSHDQSKVDAEKPKTIDYVGMVNEMRKLATERAKVHRTKLNEGYRGERWQLRYLDAIFFEVSKHGLLPVESDASVVTNTNCSHSELLGVYSPKNKNCKCDVV